MSKQFHVVLWAPLLFCALFLIYWIDIYVNEIIEFEHYVLEKQLNYTTDSAIDAMLVDADIDADYLDVTFQKVDPQLAKDDIAHTLSLDFGLVATDTTKTHILNKYVKCIIVAGWDGYYTFSIEHTSDKGDYELIQSPKIPYFYRTTNADKLKEVQYCLTLDPTYGYCAYIPNGTGNFRMENIGYYSPSLTPNTEAQAIAINNAIADSINWALHKAYVSGKTSTSHINIPNTAERLKTYQSVDSPTVICISEGMKHSFSSAVVADGLAGSKVVANDPAVGYDIPTGVTVRYRDSDGVNKIGTLPTGKWYAKSSWWNDHVLQTTTLTPIIFDTVFEAASEGYNNLNLMFLDEEGGLYETE